MAKRKVCVVVTARPSYSRIRSALVAIAAHPKLELQLVIAASALLDRFGNILEYVHQDGFEVAARVHTIVEGETPLTSAKSTGLSLMELATVFDNLQPDVVISVADRYETLATAVAASYMNIPVAHVQGGEVTGSIDEKVRHAVTKLANLHFVATQQAARNVIRMGEDPSTVFVTGCPSIDLAAQICASPDLGFNPYARYGGVGPMPDLGNGYLVIMQHSVTTEYDKARSQIEETLYAVHELGMSALWFWPNVDAGSDSISKGIRIFREHHSTEAQLHFLKNMEPLDFLRLIHNACCLVGNSSVGIRESSFLGVPVVNIGTRQSGRERGPNVMDVSYARDEIRRAVQQQLSHGRYPSASLYGNGHAGERIADLLATEPLKIEKQLMYTLQA